MNQVILVGRLTKDLELKQAQKTSKVYTRFSIAVKDYRSKEKTQFFNITAFDHIAQRLVTYTGKGEKILITGHLNQDFYTNSEGGKRDRIQIILDDFEFLGAKNRTHVAQGENETKVKEVGVNANKVEIEEQRTPEVVQTLEEVAVTQEI